MSDTLTLAAETRDQVGKGASRSLRREGRVPAVIYGQNKAAASIHLEEKALVKALMTGHFFTSVIMVDGQRTLAKDVAFHPVTDRPLHVDFVRIGEHETVTVAVPVVFTDEDQSGIKQGGVLNVTRHEIELVVRGLLQPALEEGLLDDDEFAVRIQRQRLQDRVVLQIHVGVLDAVVHSHRILIHRLKKATRG